MSTSLIKFIPKNSIQLIEKWINKLNIDLKFVNPRKTKLGDFRFDNINGYQITVNNDLNLFSSLITLTHEIAHAFVYKKYQNKVNPHGKEWKDTYKGLMLNFFNHDIFPEDIISSLAKHLITPTASTSCDINLSLILRQYDINKSLTVNDIKFGEKFIYSSKTFVKVKKLRKRIKCYDEKNKKFYLFNPITKIGLIN
tara:strand:+ start:372 stop:962 length:591 start_codon:yes stop_codon:yes gene_type:complete